MSLSDRAIREYEVSQALYDAVSDSLTPLLNNYPTTSLKQEAIIESYMRCFAYMDSGISLKEFHQFQCLMATTRSMIEMFFDMLLLEADTVGQQVEKFYAFMAVKSYAASEEIVLFYDEYSVPHDDLYKRKKEILSDVEKRTEIYNIIRRLWCDKDKIDIVKFKRRNQHWSGMSMYDRAKAIDATDGGFRYMLFYKKIGQLLNDYVHSGCVGFLEQGSARHPGAYAAAHRIAQDVFYEASILCLKSIKTDTNQRTVENAISIIEQVRQDIFISINE